MPDYHFQYEPAVIFRAEPRWKFCREPVLRRMPDGTLVCLIYTGGPKEPHPDNLVVITRSSDNGASWSDGEVLFQHNTRSVWATELFTETGTPQIFVHTFNSECSYHEIQVYRSFSDDSGKTWSEPVSLPGGCGNVSVRQGIKTAAGTLVFPVYWMELRRNWNWPQTTAEFHAGIHQGDYVYCCGALRSVDSGSSYSLHGYLKADGLLLEPNIVEVAPGYLVMLMRADKTGVLYRSESTDDGITWSTAKATDIPDPGSKVSLVKINDLAVMVNNLDASQRSGLSLSVSKDGFNTWEKRLDLVTVREGRKANICYPHLYADAGREILFVACDSYREHYLLKVPYKDFV